MPHPGAPSGGAAARDGHGGDDDADDDVDRDDEPIEVVGAIPTGTTVISIVDDDSYRPSVVEIDPGGSVTFVNQHHDEHSATGSAFDTGVIGPGFTATVTFDRPGSYAFACRFHPEMTGTIGVRDSTGVVPEPTAPPSALPPTAASVPVDIADFAFEPLESVVAVGTTVTWTNTGPSPHTVTGADGSFDSGVLDVGGTSPHTFDQPGTFAYACRLHPDMQATVVVDPSLPGVPGAPSVSPGAASPSPGA
jgi:plastocyanin